MGLRGVIQSLLFALTDSLSQSSNQETIVNAGCTAGGSCICCLALAYDTIIYIPHSASTALEINVRSEKGSGSKVCINAF